MISRVIAGVGGLVALVAVNLTVARYEAALSEGERVYLPTEGYDPRSLIQGDYMRFRASVEPERLDDRVGVAVLDADGVIERVRPGVASAPNERVIRWRKDDQRAAFGANEWFIEEGTGEAYRDFRYAILHVAPDGTPLLIGLADADRRRMGPEPTRWFGAVAAPGAGAEAPHE